MGEFVDGGTYTFQLPKRNKEISRIQTGLAGVHMFYGDMASIVGDHDHFSYVKKDELTGQERARLQFLIKQMKDRVDKLYETLCGSEVVKEPDFPAHLKEDARYLTCSKCGRMSYDLTSVGMICNMPQPSGERCQGIFEKR
jgi:hypothetical protein